MNAALALTPAERARLSAYGLIAPATRRGPDRKAWAGKYRRPLHDRQRKALAKLNARTPLSQKEGAT